MAKEFTIKKTDPEAKTRQEIVSTLGGIGGGFDPSKYRVQTGREVAEADKPFNMMLFGDKGSGKTYTIVSLLRLGFKVMVLITDYGKVGMETVYSYFAAHPEESYLLDNLRQVVLDYEGLNEFSKRPASLVPDIYEWDPDVIFWDGCSAYQEIEAEKEATGTESDFTKKDWDAWRMTRAATVYPLDRILALRNPITNKPWMKFVTMLEDKKGEYEEIRVAGKEPIRKLKPGTEITGPLLHTSARKIAAAGFSLVVRLSRFFGLSLDGVTPAAEKYRWETAVEGIETKQRGFGIPPVVEGVDFQELWEKYIGPKVRAYKVGEKKVETKAEPSASE